MFPQNFCPFPSQNFIGWESSHHPTYSPKNFGKHIATFWRNIQRHFENVAICFPQIFVLYPFKISLSGKIPTILSFYFYFYFFVCFPLQVFSFLFLSYDSFFLFFVLSDKLPFPPTFITSSHLATANHYHHPCRRQLPSPLPPPTATTILFSLFFGVQVSLKCKSLYFGLWVCFDLVFL